MILFNKMKNILPLCHFDYHLYLVLSLHSCIPWLSVYMEVVFPDPMIRLSSVYWFNTHKEH